jgi:hypothetical protein
MASKNIPYNAQSLWTAVKSRCLKDTPMNISRAEEELKSRTIKSGEKSLVISYQCITNYLLSEFLAERWTPLRQGHHTSFHLWTAKFREKMCPEHVKFPETLQEISHVIRCCWNSRSYWMYRCLVG